MGVGFLIGGQSGMLIAFVIAAGMNLFSYWNSDKMVLRMHNAREVDERSAPDFYRMVRDLAARAELPMPKVYIIDEAQPNAFLRPAAIRRMRRWRPPTGLLRSLTPEEVAAVMAHELAHVQNRDTLIMTITATLAGAIAMLGNFALFFRGGNNNNPLGIIGVLVAMIVAPFAAMLVQDGDQPHARIFGRSPGARKSAATRCGCPRHCARSPVRRAASATPGRKITRPPRTCSSSTRLSGERMDSLFLHPSEHGK